MTLATQTVAADDAAGETGPAGPGQQALPQIDEIRRHFPQFEVIECLGRGGMGVVYKARQPRLDRLVAIKILAGERQKDARFADRFMREAQALARMNHPNIVTVYDFGETNGLYYLLMEYVDGMSLRQLLQARKLAPAEALEIVPHICEALQYAHEQGIVHRDIKPENLLLDQKGRVKIADFGIAKILREPLPTPSAPPAQEKTQPMNPIGGLTQDQVIGTPHYMAPEQVEKPGEVDHRADIYSLGVVFYEMLTGELPLGKFAPPSSRSPVDVRLDEVVLQALEKEPARRYQHASEVKTAVETIAKTEGTASMRVPPTIPPAGQAPGRAPLTPSRRSGSWKMPAIIATCLLLLMAIPIGILALLIGVRMSHLPVPGQAQVRPTLRLLVHGTVRDASTGSPISGARVEDNGYGANPTRVVQQAWTDAAGQYQLRTWDEEHTLAISAIGYETQLATITTAMLSTGKEKQAALDVRLAPLQPGRTNLQDAALLLQSVRRGKKAWEQGDYIAGFALLLPAALKGDPVAQHRVGVMYTTGQGVNQDLSEATRWFRKAAEQGQAEAQYSLGLRYSFGQSVAQDHREAHHWFQLAAGQGIGAAAAALARQFMRGEGVAEDPVEAYKWAIIAANQGDPNDGESLKASFKERLSPAEIAEGQRRAKEFKSRRVAPADP